MRLRQIRFDGKNGESHFGCQELEQPILELKELARAVGRFAERDDPCVADDSLEQLEVGEPVACFNRLQPNRSRANPLGHCRFLPRLCREDNDSDHDERLTRASRIRRSLPASWRTGSYIDTLVGYERIRKG